MIRVGMEVSGGSGDPFRVEIRAQSIEQAVRQVLASHPGCEARVLFPIDPEAFFVGGEGRVATISRGVRRHANGGMTLERAGWHG